MRAAIAKEKRNPVVIAGMWRPDEKALDKMRQRAQVRINYRYITRELVYKLKEISIEDCIDLQKRCAEISRQLSLKLA